VEAPAGLIKDVLSAHPDAHTLIDIVGGLVEADAFHKATPGVLGRLKEPRDQGGDEYPEGRGLRIEVDPGLLAGSGSGAEHPSPLGVLQLQVVQAGQ
jgi:hypothetical protein